MKKIDLSIIIVSFNTCELTVDCVRSIRDTVKKTSYEVIVVDNASSDDSVEKLENVAAEMKNVTVIKNKKNYGFSKANNTGVEKSSGEYVLFLNSDTVVYDQTLDGMVEFMKAHPDAGASTCYLIMPNGKLDMAAHRGFPTPWRSFAHFSGLAKVFPHARIFSGYSPVYPDISKTHRIEVLAGAFMLVRREAGEEAGWWDEDYFWYGEDIDFCYKLHEKGWKIYFVPKYRILHYKGASGGIKKESKGVTHATIETRRMVTKARFDAMKIFYDKHYKNKYPRLINSLVLLGINAKKKLTLKVNGL